VFSIDAVPEAVQAVINGEMEMTVFQDASAHAAGAAEVGIAIVRGERGKEDLIVPYQLVTKENANEFLEVNK
jgi:inositol transport system substrate-binding protein